MIRVSPCFPLPEPLFFLTNDLVYFPFQVLGRDGSPYSLSGFTAAKMTIREVETSNVVVSFTSTGSTYQIDISGRATGNLIFKANSFGVSAGSYVFDFEVSNSTQKLFIMGGKVTVQQSITQ